SLFFGLLHINYNYDQWLNITLIIGAGSLVYFYFLLKYQTIVPLMIAHGLQDFLVCLEQTEELTGIYSFVLVIMILIWAVCRFGLGMKIKLER
ncbi:MAG: CPBP family intramembrane metalloprotease, partial [Turicibacter sp.]|nr:CPBP family intramembrane metalloprotease [Turicibacter sp.]